MLRHLEEPSVYPPTFPQWLGRLCEAFHCTPSVAYREWLTVPVGLLEEIMEARGFAETKAALDRAKDPSDLTGPWVDLVKAVTEAVAQEDIDRAAAGH